MRKHSERLVEQAEMVSNELIRVAILWLEMWHEGLETASHLYFGNHDIAGMLAALEPLHEVIDKGPETLKEIACNHMAVSSKRLLIGVKNSRKVTKNLISIKHGITIVKYLEE
jgi:hypothetical protein